jgi:hypothetical protein
MPTKPEEEVLLKTDALGRVRTPAARREQLLDEFERSGMSGVKFAELVGLKYQTFATWVQSRHRKHRIAATKPSLPAVPKPLRWMEAVLEPAAPPAAPNPAALLLHLPGGGRVEITDVRQVPLVVALVRALEPAPRSC